MIPGKSSRTSPVLYAVTISLSAALLFSVEPMMAKRILPWFGGSAAVWTVCLVFYQTVLLLGYSYARLLTTHCPPRKQSWIHGALLALSLALLPIEPAMRSPGLREPAWHILLLLAKTIGVPFLLLSSTTPVLQHWLSAIRSEAPYWLFAVSNVASLAALLAYPTMIEPVIGTHIQILGWSAVYIVFVALCVSVALSVPKQPQIRAHGGEGIWLSPFRKLFWFALATCSSTLLLAFTNHISQNVAPVPLLWVLPLSLYLLSFVLSFAGWRVYHRGLWLRLLAIALGATAYEIYDLNAVISLYVSVPIFLFALFVCCMFCHSELNRLRPPNGEATAFYLVIAAGGAAGSIFVGLIAPAVFEGIYELPFSLLLTAALAVVLIWREGAWPVRALWVAVSVAMAAVTILSVQGYHRNALSIRRSFYGSLRVLQTPHAGPEQVRTLFHGTIEHGAEYVWPGLRRRPGTYYGPESGIGIVLRESYASTKRVGVIGLGVGTLAAYARPGDVFQFYEINDQVIDMARALFFYLRLAPATVRIVEGDGRLSILDDTSPAFDVLAVDAFSGDAIPVHLLTREAMQVYFQHLKPNGTIAVHVSNDFLDLAPVVAQLGDELGFPAILVHNHSNADDQILAADWVLISRNPDVLNNTAVKLHAIPIAKRPGLRAWTDDYNNLFQILKTPQLQ